MTATTHKLVGQRAGELRYFLWVVALILVCVAGAASNDYFLTIATSAGIWFIVVSALNLVVGYSGQFSAGHAALFGIGAYSAALAEIHLRVVPAFSIAIGLLAAGFVAALVSVPLNRLRGPFLAMATFALQLAFTELLLKGGVVTGGANGLTTPTELDFSPLTFFVVLAACCGVVAVVLFNLLSFKTGRALRAIRADETMSETLGIQTSRYRTIAFTISGAIAGVAGYWQLRYIGFIDPSLFDLPASIAFLAVIVIGGRGQLAGPLLGVAFYYAAHTFLSSFPVLEALLYGVLVVFAVMYAPQGLAGVIVAVRSAIHSLARRDKAVTSTAMRIGNLSPLPSGLTETRAENADQVSLQVSGLAKSYGGVEVLTDVSFEIGQSEIVGLIGPNGAGKTTLLNILNGLTPSSAGTVRIFGTALPSSADPIRSAELGIARTFQVPRLVDSLRVIDNVVLGHHRHIASSFGEDILSWTRSRREDRRAYLLAQSVLGTMGLADYANARVDQLPHGLRRFVEIARALLEKPRLLLLDEPGAGLEPTEIDHLIASLIHIKRELGIPMVVVDHNMRLIMGLSDRVIVLHTGRLISQGTPEEVQRNEAVAEAYLGTSASQLDAQQFPGPASSKKSEHASKEAAP
ncbi:MAG: ATP-binding cassette domain-containing protein [Hyphomicrobiaceae bacterium]